MKINIRNAVETDYESYKALMLQSWKHHIALRPDVYRLSDDFLTMESYSTLLKECDVLVAVDDENTMLGAVSYSIKDMKASIIHPFKSLWIADLAVDENYRRQGIAEMLIEKVKETAKENGVDRIQLNVNALNDGAIKLYEKQGFAPEMVKMEYILK